MSANMSAPKQTSFYKKHLICPVCMDMFTDPRALPCHHTFCLQCLHSYVMSVTSAGEGTGKAGFECPVCRSFTKVPLHGLCPYSWAENYPPNFTVRDLVEETLKQSITRKEEIGGKNKILQDRGGKKRGSNKDLDIIQASVNRKRGFYCDLHNQPFCSSCERVEAFGKGQIADEDNEGGGKARTHRSLSRLGRSTSSDYELPSDAPSLDSEGLAQEFASARAMDSPVLPGKQKDRPSEPLEHMTLKRLYNDDRDIKPRETPTIPVSRELGDIMPLPVHKDREPVFPVLVDRQRHDVTAKHDVTASGRSSSIEEQGLSDDLREFLSIHLPDQGPVNPVGHLNDIKEEDEEARQAELLHSVSRSMDKIYVRIRSDDLCCSVSGVTTLPDGRVLIADENNDNVKMFDSAGDYLNHICFRSAPFDIDSIEECQAVVTFPNQKCMRVLLVTETIDVMKTIEFEKRCQGVSFHDHKFFIAMGSEIRVLSYEGELIHKFNRDPSKRKIFSSGKSIFADACYVAVDDKHVHVSDMGKRCLTTINYKGELVTSYKEGEYVKILGLCRGPGRKVFACQWPNTLLLLTVSEHGSHIRNVLVLDKIQAAHYDMASQKLWVTLATDNFINQYSFKHNYFA